LRLTTRDVPDYDVLMKGRLKILADHNLSLADIQEVIGSLRPLEGAKEFLDELRSLGQVIILSDTFEEFASPLMKQLGWPTLLCHRLEVVNGKILDYKLRITEQKKAAVAALKALRYKVIAAGDSFNDIAMLAEAEVGIFFARRKILNVNFRDFRSRNIPRSARADQKRILKKLLEKIFGGLEDWLRGKKVLHRWNLRGKKFCGSRFFGMVNKCHWRAVCESSML